MLKKLVSAVLCVMIALSSTAGYLSVSESYTVEAAAVDYETPYYYSQMPKNAQKVYKELKKAALECKKKVKINVSIDQKDFDMVAEMLILHDPETFNIKNIEANDVTRSSATFNIQYVYSKDTYNKMVAAYDKKVDKILSKLKDDMSTYKKVRIIHDEIINNTVYDLDSPTNATVYGTLVKKKAKCDGYAKTFSYICSKAGIRTVTVIGDTVDSSSDELHMWNKVYYNKKWYNVDVTWDDPVTSLKDNLSYNYFMISDSVIKRSHTEDNLSFKVPKATDSSKSYFKVNSKYAEDLDGAKSLIKKSLVTAAKNKTTYIEIQCSSKSLLNSVKKYVEDTNKMRSVLQSAKKDSSNSKLVTDLYSYSVNENTYTIRIAIFYKNTTLDSYYNDTKSVDKSMLTALAHFGIK